jgi:transposase
MVIFADIASNNISKHQNRRLRKLHQKVQKNAYWKSSSKKKRQEKRLAKKNSKDLPPSAPSTPDVPAPAPQIIPVVAFGAATFHWMRGHDKMAYKRLFPCLQRRGMTVLKTSEYFTSQRCHVCHSKLIYNSSDLQQGMFQGENQDEITDNYLTSMMNVGYKYPYCPSCQCHWHRDENSAISIAGNLSYSMHNSGQRHPMYQANAPSVPVNTPFGPLVFSVSL